MYWCAMKNRVLSALLVLLCAVVACNRDPNVAKKRYVDGGNKYYENGKYKEALIMYRKALQRDLKYGEAYYRSALAEIALQQYLNAIRDLQRAVELQPENLDAHDRLTNIYLNVYVADKKHSKQVTDELRGLADKYAKRFPNSYSEARLRGYLALFDNDAPNALKFFEKANTLKPHQADLVMIYMQTLAGTGHIEEAQKLGYDMLNSNPAALNVYDVLYVIYAKQGKVDEAEKLLQTKVQKNPKNAEVRLQLAAHYFAAKKRDQMLAVLNDVEKDPATFPKGPLQVGDFFARIRDYDAAGQRYQQGIQKDPKDKHVYQKRMIEVLIRKNQKDEAFQMVNAILKEDPKDTEAIAIRASLTLLAGNKEQLQSAIDDLQSVVSKMPDNPVVRYNLGRALLAKQNLEAARVQFEEAIKIRPDYLQPRLALAQMLLQKGESAKVAQMADEVLSMDPNNLPARLLRGRASIAMGDTRRAREILTKTSEQFPDVAEAKLQVAALDLREKNFKAAEESFRKLYDQSHDPRALMGLVDTYASQGQQSTALKILREELAKNPDRIEYRIAIGNLAASSGDYPTAVQEYKTVLDKMPNNGQIWLQLSEVYRRAGQNSDAVNAVRKAQEFAPNNVAAHLQLAMLYDTSGNRSESKPVYEHVLRLQPDNPIALNNLAFLLAESGNDLDQALTMAQKARQQRPQDDDVADTLGWIYIKKNIPDSAVGIFKELVTRNPAKATYRYHLAMALYQKGDKMNAKRECEVALKSANKPVEVTQIRELMSKIG